MKHKVGTTTVERVSSGWVSIRDGDDRVILTDKDMQELVFLYQAWQQDQEVERCTVTV